MLPLTVMGGVETTIDGIKYEVIPKIKQATVLSNSYSGDIVIPATITYNNVVCDVTSIGEKAFYFCSYLTSVTIPNSVTSIRKYAFYACSSLTSITIPNNVTSIGDFSFGFCTGLISVTIPNSVTSIGNSAFHGCSGLTSVIIGNSVTSIGDSAFHGCSGLTSVTIGNSVTSIGASAFYDCSGLISVTIPNSVDSIGSSAFHGCSGLTSVTIGNSVTSIGSSAFYGCSGLTSVTIGNSVTSIKEGAFSYCSRLTSVTIPGSLTSIGSDVFKKSPLSEVKVSVSDYASFCKNKAIRLFTSFYYGYFSLINSDGKEIVNYIIPDVVTTIGDSAFYRCSGLTSVTIPNSVTNIGERAFTGCSGLTSVIIPNSVTNIGESAFTGCSGLTSVTIPNSVTSIGSSAFYGCSGLTSVIIPNSVTSIGDYAFCYCSGLTSVTIPNSVTSIEYCAFEFCSGLTSLIIPNSVTSIGHYAFSGCSGLTSVTIGNSVTSIGSDAFRNCPLSNVKVSVSDYAAFCNNKVIRLIQSYYNGNIILIDSNGKEIVNYIIPDGVMSIGDYAFFNCSGLTSVTIPGSLTNIGSDAFRNCPLSDVKVSVSDYAAFCNNKVTYLIWSYYKGNIILIDSDGKEIVNYIIPDGVTSIGDYGFFNCSGLTSVTIPNSVTSIEYSAFEFCSGLTSLIIPNSVTSIGNWAFSNCIGLTSMNIPNSVTSIGDGAFVQCSNLASVTIGSGVKSIGSYAFADCVMLLEVYCNATTVPSTQTNAFEDSDVEYASLFVPEASIASYKASDPWKQFGEIKPLKSQSIQIIATSCSREYGDENPTFQYTVQGGEITGTPQITCKATKNSPVGEYVIEISAGSITNPNVKLVNGTLTITKAPLTVIVEDYTATYYESIPYEFPLRYEGFKNGDTEEVLIVKPVAKSEYLFLSEEGEYIELEVGEYEITAKGGEAQNYEFIYVSGTFTYLPEDPDISSDPDIPIGLDDLGDVNYDGSVNVTDAMIVVDYILNDPDPSFIDEEFLDYDIDYNGVINVTDVMLIVEMILNEPSFAPKNTLLCHSDGMLLDDDGMTCTLRLDGAGAYTACQMIVTLPEGCSLTDASPNINYHGHREMMTRDLGNGRYVVVLFSPDGERLGEGGLIDMRISGHYADGISVSNIQMCSADRRTVALRDVRGVTTGIRDINSDAASDKYYNTQGMEVKSPQRGVYIRNNRKVVVK